MKKVFSLFSKLFLFLALIFTPKAFAAQISDVAADFWASAEINQMVDEGIMSLDANGNFNPLGSVERADFTSMLIKVLNQSGLEIYIENPFEDVDTTTEHYDDIMRSEQIGLVYGYPDGTFKPKNDVNKAEVTSAVSHITKDTIYDLSILDEFVDTDKIPDWAKLAYAKTVKYNLFVNYPDRQKFEPDRDITRAETAVLLAKLKNAISNVKEDYNANEVERSLSVEHLSIHKNAEANTVTITNLRKIVAEGNILKVSFVEKFKAKNANIGDNVEFTVAKDVVTDEGTLVIPQGAKFHATIENLVQPKRMNKSGAVKFLFNRLEMPNGVSSDMNATVYNKHEGYLTASSKGKLAAYTLGGLVVGAGVGSAIGFPADEVGTAYAIGLPVGAVAGFFTGLFTKGSTYKANKGDELYIRLNQDLSIQENL